MQHIHSHSVIPGETERLLTDTQRSSCRCESEEMRAVLDAHHVLVSQHRGTLLRGVAQRTPVTCAGWSWRVALRPRKDYHDSRRKPETWLRTFPITPNAHRVCKCATMEEEEVVVVVEEDPHHPRLIDTERGVFADFFACVMDES